MKLPLLASAALLAVACGESFTQTYSEIDIRNAPGAAITVNGVALVFDGTVVYHSRTDYDSRRGTEHSTTLNGLPFTLHDGVLTIGDTRFVGVERGARVELGAAGVVVDGENRGPLPSAAD